MREEYTQAFIVVMETGIAALIHVNAETLSHGKGLAMAEAQDRLDGQIYHMCSFPVEKPVIATTFKVLKPAGDV